MIHEKSNFPKPGDMRKEVYDTNNNGIVDNAERVNGHTVDSDVPQGAEFTDTTYSEASSEAAGLMSASDKAKLDGLEFDEEITENSGNLVTSGTVFTALAGKQDTLTVDVVPTEDSENMVSSGAVFTALAGKQDALYFDASPTENSTNPVSSGAVFTALNSKQGTLSFDTAPTENSTNPVTSGGIFTALSQKQDAMTVDSIPTENSSNPVASGAVFTALNAKQDTIQSSSVIKVYLEGTEMNLAEALNAVIAMIGNSGLTSEFSCDRPAQNNAENPETPNDPETLNSGENGNA